MDGVRRTSLSVAAASILVLVLAGGLGAQPRTPDESAPVPAPPSAPGPPTSPAPQPVPAQPAPVPPSPTGPAVPTPPPTAKEEPEPLPPPETAIEPRPVPEDLLPTRAPTLFGPSVFVGPDLFNPPAPQGWLSITPTFTLSGEYNDNLFQNSSNRISDFSIAFTPGVTVSVQRPSYRLLAGYNVGGQLYVRETELNGFGKQQQFFADLAYQVAPGVTFTLTDQFVKDRNSNSVTTSGESVGRRDSFRNTLTPRLRWQATPSTALGMLGSYTMRRFQDTGDGSRQGRDSDTYRLGFDVDHRLTGRLTGTLDLVGSYLDFENQAPARTYTLRPGAVYDVTQTLRAQVSAGPSLVDHHGDQEVRPSVSASLVQAFKFGSLRIGYDRAVTAEAVAIAEVQSFYGTLIVPTLVRGLQLSFIPRYSIIGRDVAGGNETERSVLTLNLRATYQIGRNFSLIGSYTFFRQTDDSSRSRDIDQNRVFLGVQYAFPINFY
jgi:hypothetical protein